MINVIQECETVDRLWTYEQALNYLEKWEKAIEDAKSDAPFDEGLIYIEIQGARDTMEADKIRYLLAIHMGFKYGQMAEFQEITEAETGGDGKKVEEYRQAQDDWTRVRIALAKRVITE